MADFSGRTHHFESWAEPGRLIASPHQAGFVARLK